MKDLRTHLYESIETLGFTMDDELAAEYINIFKNGGFETLEDRYADIDLWDSLGDEYQQYVLKTSQFSGAIDRESGDHQIRLVVRNTDFKDVIYTLGDHISNIFDAGHSDDDTDHFVLCYKGKKPVHMLDIDPEDPSTWEDFVFPQRNWRNMVKQEYLEWVIDELADRVWWRNNTSIKTLHEYTGWELYDKGKRVA